MPSDMTLNGVSFGPRPPEATSWAFSQISRWHILLPFARGGSKESQLAEPGLLAKPVLLWAVCVLTHSASIY